MAHKYPLYEWTAERRKEPVNRKGQQIKSNSDQPTLFRFALQSHKVIKPVLYINCIYNGLTRTQSNIESRGRKGRKARHAPGSQLNSPAQFVWNQTFLLCLGKLVKYAADTHILLLKWAKGNLDLGKHVPPKVGLEGLKSRPCLSLVEIFQTYNADIHFRKCHHYLGNPQFFTIFNGPAQDGKISYIIIAGQLFS